MDDCYKPKEEFAIFSAFFDLYYTQIEGETSPRGSVFQIFIVW